MAGETDVTILVQAIDQSSQQLEATKVQLKELNAVNAQSVAVTGQVTAAAKEHAVAQKTLGESVKASVAELGGFRRILGAGLMLANAAKDVYEMVNGFWEYAKAAKEANLSSEDFTASADRMRGTIRTLTADLLEAGHINEKMAVSIGRMTSSMHEENLLSYFRAFKNKYGELLGFAQANPIKLIQVRDIAGDLAVARSLSEIAMATLEANLEDGAENKKEVYGLMRKVAVDMYQDEVKACADTYDKEIAIARVALDKVAQLEKQKHDALVVLGDKDTSAVREKYDREIAAAKGNAAKIELLEKQKANALLVLANKQTVAVIALDNKELANVKKDTAEELKRKEQASEKAIELAKQEADAKRAIQQQYFAGVSGLLGAAADLARNFGLAGFRVAKGLAMAQAAINTAGAIVGFLANPSGYAGLALSIIAGVTGAVQMATIAMQQPSFAAGGLVGGEPSLTDNRMAMVASGEFIMPTARVQQYGPATFEAFRQGVAPQMNAGSLAPYVGHSSSFAAGGMVGSINARANNLTVRTRTAIVDSRSAMRQFLARDGPKEVISMLRKRGNRMVA